MILLQGSSLVAGQLTVSWDDNSSNELGFHIERSTNGSTFTTIASVSANTKSYTDTTVAAATTYWYRVRAYNLTASSAYSNVTSSTTSSTTATPTATSTATTSSSGRITTLTVRAVTGKSTPQPLVLNFTVSGSSKSVLLRGVGPGLAQFTSSKTLPDPYVHLYSGSTLLGGNDNWGGTSLLWSIFSRVGAYALTGYSKDAVYYTSLSTRTYAAIVNGDYSGLAQAEIYDADISTSPAGRFSKLSARALVGTGSGILTTGFVVEGDASIKLLVRAIGPSLTGVTGVLNDPVLSLYKGGTLLKRNDNWGGASTLASTFTQVGASSLGTTSKDSAFVITLSPGVYSATITGTYSTVGVAQLEFYQVP